jgi:hypothetical protein
MITDITTYTDAQKIPAPFTAPETVEPLREALAAIPGVRFLTVSRDTLGGEYRASLYIRLSLEAPESWPYRIYHNSRHLALWVRANQDVEVSLRGSGLPKFRAGKSKDHAHIVARVRKWVEACNAAKAEG